jgi:hypothetical protein
MIGRKTVHWGMTVYITWTLRKHCAGPAPAAAQSMI